MSKAQATARRLGRTLYLCVEPGGYTIRDEESLAARAADPLPPEVFAEVKPDGSFERRALGVA